MITSEIAKRLTLADGYNWWADPRGGDGMLAAVWIAAMVIMVAVTLIDQRKAFL